MALILGIDPGTNTGLATIKDGRLTALRTIAPLQLHDVIREIAPERIVLEDSRLQSFVWTTTGTKAAAAKMARNLGEIDAWCKLIVAVCEQLGVACHSISPAGKGRKIDAADFKRITAWAKSSNQHERDACMVAWPYRNVARYA